MQFCRMSWSPSTMLLPPRASAPLPGLSRAPEVRNGTEVEEAAEQLRSVLYQTVDADESDEDDGAGGCRGAALRAAVPANCCAQRCEDRGCALWQHS